LAWLRAARFLRLVGKAAAAGLGALSGTYAQPGAFFVFVLATSITPKLFMVGVRRKLLRCGGEKSWNLSTNAEEGPFDAGVLRTLLSDVTADAVIFHIS
jgi:hypothetical protein